MGGWSSGSKFPSRPIAAQSNDDIYIYKYRYLKEKSFIAPVINTISLLRSSLLFLSRTGLFICIYSFIPLAGGRRASPGPLRRWQINWRTAAAAATPKSCRRQHAVGGGGDKSRTNEEKRSIQERGRREKEGRGGPYQLGRLSCLAAGRKKEEFGWFFLVSRREEAAPLTVQ